MAQRSWPLDCANADAASQLDKMVEALGGLDVLLLAYGTLGDQAELEHDPGRRRKIDSDQLQQRGQPGVWPRGPFWKSNAAGALLVIGSVAGDRGRRSNFIYGATKGGLARLVEGIAHNLAPLGARAVLIKPGFVDTPMTANIARKACYGLSPSEWRRLIAAAARRGGPIVYAPAFWWFIMLIIQHLPTFIFNRLNTLERFVKSRRRRTFAAG